MRVMVLLFSVALVLFSFGSVLGQEDQGVYFHSIEGNTGPEGAIAEGDVVTFKLGFRNNEAEHIIMMSNGFQVALGTGDVTWTETYTTCNPAHAWDFGYFQACGYTCPPIFFGNFFPHQYFSCDGLLADTVALGALCSETFLGLPPGYDDWSYAIHIGPVSGNGTLVLDNVDWFAPSNDWSWAVFAGQVECNWDGPHEFIVGEIGEPPVIAEIENVTMTIGETFTTTATATGDPVPTFSIYPAVDGAGITAGGDLTYTPPATGVFEICVVATNTAGADTECFTVTVNPAPEIPVIAEIGDVTMTIGETYTTTATATGYPVPTFSIYPAVDGAGITAGGDLTYTPPATGVFEICVVATNTAGTDTECFTVTVNPAPEIPVIAELPDVTISLGDTYTTTATATGYPVPTFSIDPAVDGAGITAGGDLTYTPPATGVFEICVVATNTAGTDTECFTVTVNPAPEIPVIAELPDVTISLGDTYTTTATATGYPVPTFSIDPAVDGAGITAGGDLTYTPAATGVYEICVVATNTSGSDTDCFTVTVNPAPEIPVVAAIDDVTITLGDTYTTTATATGYPAPTFTINPPVAHASITPGGDLTYEPTAAGEYEICVVATNTAGSDSECFTVTVNPAPEIPEIDPIASVTIEMTDVLSFTATATGYPDPTFSIDPAVTGAAITPGGDFTYTPTAPGDYEICIVATNDEGFDTECFIVTVADPADTVKIYHDEDPIHLKDLNDRVILVWIENEDNANVEMASIRVHGKIPPYTPGTYPKIEDGKIVTDCFVFRFLSVFRPIPESETGTFIVTYNLNGVLTTRTGFATIDVPAADVTLDGYVDQKDVDLMRKYLWENGPPSELDQMMDVNRDGKVSPADLTAILRAIQ